MFVCLFGFYLFSGMQEHSYFVKAAHRGKAGSQPKKCKQNSASHCGDVWTGTLCNCLVLRAAFWDVKFSLARRIRIGSLNLVLAKVVFSSTYVCEGLNKNYADIQC